MSRYAKANQTIDDLKALIRKMAERAVDGGKLTKYCDDEEDKIQADLENITVVQYKFNKWMDQLEQEGNGFKNGFKTKSSGPLPVKLTWWKCWFWWLIPGYFLGTDDRIRFRSWSIGHCLNCDADPYDGQVEAWSYDGNWFRGALIRCNKCGQLRWQAGESGRDY